MDGVKFLSSRKNQSLLNSMIKEKEVETVPKDEPKKYYCKFCGKQVRYHHFVCADCRPKWLRELFEGIRPLFELKDRLSAQDIKETVDIEISTLHKILKEFVERGCLDVWKEGRLKFYALPKIKVQVDTQRQVNKINELKFKGKSEGIVIENSGLPKLQNILKDGIKEPEEWIPEPKNISKELLSPIQLITDLLPSLFFASIITIEPQDKILNANFIEQKTLLDLYETLPKQLKSLVKLHIDPESPIQKISIPLEG